MFLIASEEWLIRSELNFHKNPNPRFEGLGCYLVVICLGDRGLDDGFDNVAGRLDRVLDDVDGFLQRDRDAQLLVKQGATDRADDGRTNNRVGGLVGLDVVGELLHESLPFKRELLL